MTQTLVRPDEVDTTLPTPAELAAEMGRPSRATRLRRRLRMHRSSLLWFSPLLVLSAVIQFVNLGGSPQRIDDEGTYVAQAYAVTHFGELSHYTYWYDHPPLGWLQLALWTKVTGAFARYDTAVLAGREFMVVAHLAAVVLLWMLARRLRFSRPTAAAAVAIYVLSPLAVQFHRTVFLDNIATPWILAAFVLAFAPRRQLVAFAGAAVCFAVAVLTKETYALFFPFLAWQLWRRAHHDIRRYTVSISAAVVILLGLGYVLLAVIKGELVPGVGRVSLFTGIGFQLSGRQASGSVFDAASQASVTTGQWLQLDPVIAVVAPVAALVCLTSKRIRPVAAALVFYLLFMLRPGYLPIPYVIAMIPLAALVIPGAIQLLVQRAKRIRRTLPRRTSLVATALVAAVAVASAAPMWGPQLRGLLLSDLDLPMRQAQSWVGANVDRGYRVVVDDAMWVDLVQDGFPRNNVIWYYKVDTDPAVQALAPNGWRDYDYIVSTNSMRTFPDGSPTVSEALKNSVEVASFGTGTTEVDVWRVKKDGADATSVRAAADERARVSAGTELAGNPRLDLGPGVKDLMTGGRVDARVLLATAQLADLGTLTVAEVPYVEGEEELQRPRRQLLVSELSGRPLTDASVARATALVTGQPAPYAPRSVVRTPQGLLITWDADAPSGLIAAPQDI